MMTGAERQGSERPNPPPFKMAGPPAIRQPNQIDVWLEHGIAFASKLGKQLLLTLCASLFRAAADWLLKGSNQDANNTLMNNMKNTATGSGYSGSSAPTSYSNRDYSGYSSESYNRYRSNGAETFPGFDRH